MDDFLRQYYDDDVFLDPFVSMKSFLVEMNSPMIIDSSLEMLVYTFRTDVESKLGKWVISLKCNLPQTYIVTRLKLTFVLVSHACSMCFSL